MFQNSFSKYVMHAPDSCFSFYTQPSLMQVAKPRISGKEQSRIYSQFVVRRKTVFMHVLLRDIKRKFNEVNGFTGIVTLLRHGTKESNA